LVWFLILADAVLFGLEEVDVVWPAHLDASDIGDSVLLIDGLEQAGEQGICNSNLGVDVG
jgi:hypothetical protein